MSTQFGGVPGILSDSSPADLVRQCVNSAACQFGSILPDCSLGDSIRLRVGSAPPRLTAHLTIGFGDVSVQQRIDSAAYRFGGVLPDCSLGDSIRLRVGSAVPCLTAHLTIGLGDVSVRQRIDSAAYRFGGVLPYSSPDGSI
jgi:hypothetical protein